MGFTVLPQRCRGIYGAGAGRPRRDALLRVYSDACTYLSGQPGQDSSYVVVVEDGSESGRVVMMEPLGDVSVNVAEYRGVIAALKWAQWRNERIKIFTDSQTVVGQVDGTKACFTRHLAPLLMQTRALLEATGSKLEWMSRDDEHHLASLYWKRHHAARHKELKHVRKTQAD